MLRLERVRADIAALGQRAAVDRQKQHTALELAQRWLSDLPDSMTLREHIQPLLRETDRWSGAIPTTPEPLSVQYRCPAVSLDGHIVIGVDGSQIFPDRHALALYYLLQVGAIIFRYNGAAPTVHTTEWLRYEEGDLFDAHGYLIGGEALAAERMVREMEVLAQLVAIEQSETRGCIFGLSDGPLLWPYTDRDSGVHQATTDYLAALAQVQLTNAIPVGYVDRPGGRPLLDVLWASRLASEDLLKRIEENPLGRLTDEHLLRQVLEPGSRTPWFTRRTATNQRHASAGQEIWFCYMDLGTARDRAIARIEVPAWAPARGDAVAALHTALCHQSAALGGYPYALARAHEEALVTTQDKTALEQAIQRQLLELGIVALPSNKARQKALLGKRQ
jgi:hypothetical protein